MWSDGGKERSKLYTERKRVGRGCMSSRPWSSPSLGSHPPPSCANVSTLVGPAGSLAAAVAEKVLATDDPAVRAEDRLLASRAELGWFGRVRSESGSDGSSGDDQDQH